MSPMIVNPYRFVSPGGGYGWSPTSLSGLKFWWRADAGLTLSGSDISTFGDQSGNSNHGSWTGARATLESNVTGSLPAARFNAAPIYTLPTNSFSGVTAAQIFLALKLDTDTAVGNAENGLWSFGTDVTNATRYVSSTDQNVYDTFGHSARFGPLGNPSVDLSTWHRLCVKAQSSGYQIWINNSSLFSNATSCGSSWRSQPWFGGIDLGIGNTPRLKGRLLEIFCYSDVKNSTDRGLADTYLADRISGAWYAAEHP